MLKEEIKILIVEDDQTLGKAMKEAVARAGYKPILCSRPDEALSAIKLQNVHGAIIDCMLPKMNGRDLAIKLHADVSKDLPVILTSGIFKDKAYAREAIQTTGAVAFLTKPFDVEELIGTLDRKLSHLADVPLLPIYDLLHKARPTPKERIRAINDSEQVHGFDLPWLYSLLLDPAISGHLNIITADGEVAGVGFQKGNIVQVNLKDTQSYFGVLLVEKGFISPAQLEVVLAQGKTRRMGEQLVEANVLSPHAVSIVISEQQSIRLSKTVADTSCKVNFIESTDISEDAQTDRTACTELIDDWAGSKLPIEWLKSFYIPWMSHSIRKGPEFTENHRSLQLYCLSRTPGLLQKALGNTTLDQLTTHFDGREDQFFRAIHVLFLCRIISFGEQQKSVNYDSHKIRLQKLNAELENQTYFERLGVSSKAKDQEIKRAYHELAKVLHPDKLSADTPEDVRELTRAVFQKINTAYEALSDSASKEVYLKELEQGRAELVLHAETLSEQAKVFLGKADSKKAKELLEEARSLAPPNSEQRLLLMWARLKTQAKPGDVRFTEDIKDQLSQLPPEDRHNPMYYFVKGLLLKYQNEGDAARKCFEHAVAIDTDFIDARRELNLIKLSKQNNKQTDLLRGDLKDVVGMLFKKKK
ncbi:MAG: response regulator [Bdellovibrionaceae bacterium]|nr:response regulator [Pseudobdellovibrionaceae bacterium]